MSSHEQWSSWGGGPLLLAASNCPVCGGPKSGGCKQASRLGRDGWLCRRSPEAVARETWKNKYLCVHVTTDGGGWSTWLPEDKLTDKELPGAPGRTTAEARERQAAYRKEQSELIEALVQEELALLQDAQHLPSWLLELARAGHVAADEAPERIALAPAARHAGLVALLERLADEALSGDRLLEAQMRLGLGQPLNLWSVGAQPTADPEEELPRGWLQINGLVLPVPGAMPAEGGSYNLLAGAGLWWPLLGLGGQLLGFEIAADHWRRQIWPDTPKYRPLSKESASRPGDQPSPYTWRLAAGLERFEPPLAIYGPRADGLCSAEALAGARALLLTEGRAVKPRIAALRWGCPAIGGHGHAAFGAMPRQLDALLDRLNPQALVLLAPDAGAPQNRDVLEALLLTAARLVLAGRQPLVAWWNQSRKASSETTPTGGGLMPSSQDGTTTPAYGAGLDPDELLIDWPDGASEAPLLRYWLVVSEATQPLALAWEAATAGGAAMGSEAELEARRQLLAQPGGPGLLRLLTTGGRAALDPLLQRRPGDLRIEAVIDRQGDAAWRWSVPGRPVALLPFEEWLEQHVPEQLLIRQQAQATTTEGGADAQEEWPARAELLRRWREGDALRAAGGDYRPPAPPSWPGARHYGEDDRADAWRWALLQLREQGRLLLQQALERWAQADGLSEAQLQPLIAQALAERQRTTSHWERRLAEPASAAALHAEARATALARHYRQEPYAQRGHMAALIADPTGAGKSHAAAQLAPALARELGLGAVLWLSKDRATAVMPLEQLRPTWPPSRHGGLIRQQAGEEEQEQQQHHHQQRVRELRPGETLPAGWELQEAASCAMSSRLGGMRARGYSNAALDSWCKHSCPHAAGCPYMAQKRQFWALRAGPNADTTPTILRREQDSRGRWCAPAVDVVRCTPALVPALAALAPGWLSRALVIVDESDHLTAAATSSHNLNHQHLQQLLAQLQRHRLLLKAEERQSEEQQQEAAATLQHLELVEQLMLTLQQLCCSARHGRYGLMPTDLHSHPLMLSWREMAAEAGLPQALAAETTIHHLLQAIDRQHDAEGVAQGLAEAETTLPELEAAPPLLLPLLLGAAGELVNHGSTLLSLVPLPAAKAKGKGKGKGVAKGKGAPCFELCLTRSTGLAHQLAASCGALVILDATASPALLENALNAPAGASTTRHAPVGLQVLQQQTSASTYHPKMNHSHLPSASTYQPQRPSKQEEADVAAELERLRLLRLEQLGEAFAEAAAPTPEQALLEARCSLADRRCRQQQEEELRRHPPMRLLQVTELGSMGRQRRPGLCTIAEALQREIADWMQATYGPGEEIAVIDHKLYVEGQELLPQHPGIRGAGAWFTTSARGSNQFADCRGLVILGMPVANLVASEAQLLALADWSGPGGIKTAQLGVAQHRAQLVGAEYLQAIGRLRLNRKPPGWGTGVVVAVCSEDLSRLAPAIPGLQRPDNPGTYGDGIEHVPAQWFGDQLGRGDQGLVAQALAGRAEAMREAQAGDAEAREAKAKGGRTRGQQRQSQAQALRERIHQDVIGYARERCQQSPGLPMALLLRELTTRAISNRVGAAAKTVAQHLVAMAVASDPQLTAGAASVSAPQAVEVLLRQHVLEGQKTGPKAA